MKRFLFLILILIVMSLTAFAQKSSTIAVLDLDAEGISASEGRIISARLRTDLFNTGKFTVIERDKMQEILDEQGFQLTACTTDECIIEVGKLIGVEKMVAGNIGKIGKLFTLTIRIVDVETGKVIKTATEDCRCDIETVVTQSVKNVAEVLAGNKIQKDTYTSSQRQSNIADAGITELELKGMSREDYVNFKRSGLTEEAWDKNKKLYNSEQKGAFTEGLKSFIFPGWGQLSMERNRGYIYLGIDLVGWITMFYSMNKFEEWQDEDNYWNNIAENLGNIGDTEGHENAVRMQDNAQENMTYYNTIGNISFFSLLLNRIIGSIEAGYTTKHYNEELKKKFKLSFTPKLNKFSKQPMLGLNIDF